jgi:hypothetical protein
VLCDGNDGRGVVGVRVDGCKAIFTGRETSGNVRGELSSLRSGVDALEERKSGGVEDGRVRKVVHLLDDKATSSRQYYYLEGEEEAKENVLWVTDEDTLAIELLRSHVVRLLSIGEHAGLHVVNVHLDGERLVGGDSVLVGGAGKLARGHVGLWDNVTHWDRVARTPGDLLTVRDGLSDAKVDEIVRGGQGGNLSSDGGLLTIVFEPGFYQVWEQR